MNLKKTFLLRAKYEATPDNLVAFTGATNIQSLKVNGTPIKFEPLKNDISTFDVLGENISINLETGEATFPESYLIKSPVSSWSFKAKDPNYTINENTYICLLGMMDGMTFAQPIPPEEISYMFTTNDGVTIEVGDEFMTEMNMQIQSGCQVGFILMGVDMNNQTFMFIDTEHQTNVTTGGVPTYSFDSEGLYDVEIELTDPDVKGIRFVGTPLTSIEISDDITSIGKNVFYDDQTWQYCDSLTSVTIGNSVTRIEEEAFLGCRSLTSVYISDIAAWCNILFSDSSSNPLSNGCNLYLNNELVTDLTIHNSVTSIRSWAFYGCSSLTSVAIGNGVTSIGSEAFRDCTGLKSVTIGSSVASIGEMVFYNCSELTSITCYAPTAPTIYNTFSSLITFGTLYYPEGSDYSSWLSTLCPYGWNMMIMAQYNVTSSDNYLALSRTSEISHLYVNGVEVTNFGDTYSFETTGSYTVGIALKDNAGDIQSMFKNAKSLKSVMFNNSFTSIGDYAFQSCTSLTSVTIGSGVTSIGEYAFSSCSSLKSVTIPDSVTSIEDYAFINCPNLTSITIGNGVTTIPSNVFNECYNLATVTIGSGVTSIEDWAFASRQQLKSITCYAPIAPSIKSNTFRDIPVSKGTLYVPTGSDYSSWMSRNPYYLGYYNWTIKYI